MTTRGGGCLDVLAVCACKWLRCRPGCVVMSRDPCPRSQIVISPQSPARDVRRGPGLLQLFSGPFSAPPSLPFKRPSTRSLRRSRYCTRHFISHSFIFVKLLTLLLWFKTYPCQANYQCNRTLGRFIGVSIPWLMSYYSILFYAPCCIQKFDGQFRNIDICNDFNVAVDVCVIYCYGTRCSIEFGWVNA